MVCTMEMVASLALSSRVGLVLMAKETGRGLVLGAGASGMAPAPPHQGFPDASHNRARDKDVGFSAHL